MTDMRKVIRPPDPTKFILAAGGYTVVARHFGIKSPSVHKWKMVPAEKVLDMEELSKKYTRYQMRPDVFGKDPAKGKKAVA